VKVETTTNNNIESQRLALCIADFKFICFSVPVKQLKSNPMRVVRTSFHGDNDQIVPIEDSAFFSAKLKVYKGASHGLCTTHKDTVNADLLEFIKP
jgi:non-heme chloroperoxidase